MIIPFQNYRGEIFRSAIIGRRGAIILYCLFLSSMASSAEEYEGSVGIVVGGVSTDDPAADRKSGSVSKMYGGFSVDFPAMNGHEKVGISASRTDQLTEGAAFETGSAVVVSERTTKKWTLTERAEGTWSRTQNGFYRSALTDEKTAVDGLSRSMVLAGDGELAMDENHSLIIGMSGEKIWADTWAETATGRGGMGWQASPDMNWAVLVSQSAYRDGRGQGANSTTLLGQYQYDLSPTSIINGHVGRIMIYNSGAIIGDNVGLIRLRRDGARTSWSLDASRSAQSGVRQGGSYLEDSASMRLEIVSPRVWRSSGYARWLRQTTAGGNKDVLRGFQVAAELGESLIPSYSAVAGVKSAEVTEAFKCDFVRYPGVYRTCFAELGVLARM